MNLSKTLFRDTDIKKLDYEKHARHIIQRVLMRGMLSDWFEIFLTTKRTIQMLHHRAVRTATLGLLKIKLMNIFSE